MSDSSDCMRHYKPVNFQIEELVPPSVIMAFGDKSWEFLDSRMLFTIDRLRDFFGVPLIINNWKAKGDRQYCGFRPPKCDVGASLSPHRLARAYDIISPKITAKEMREKIIDNSELFPYITRIEDGVSWLHIDNLMTGMNHIYLFKDA